MVNNILPIRKWRCVRGSGSRGSSQIYVRGLELKIPSSNQNYFQFLKGNWSLPNNSFQTSLLILEDVPRNISTSCSLNNKIPFDRHSTKKYFTALFFITSHSKSNPRFVLCIVFALSTIDGTANPFSSHKFSKDLNECFHGQVWN